MFCLNSKRSDLTSIMEKIIENGNLKFKSFEKNYYLLAVLKDFINLNKNRENFKIGGETKATKLSINK